MLVNHLALRLLLGLGPAPLLALVIASSALITAVLAERWRVHSVIEWLLRHLNWLRLKFELRIFNWRLEQRLLLLLLLLKLGRHRLVGDYWLWLHLLLLLLFLVFQELDLATS